MRRWMEVVAGCYEQVLFGFAVHPEPEADGHREVRARARRDPRVVGRRGVRPGSQRPR